MIGHIVGRHNKSATSNTDDFVKGGSIDGGDIEYTTHALWEPCCCNNEGLYLPEAMSSSGLVRPDCRLIARTVCHCFIYRTALTVFN